ncbi:hypothetical protein B0H21DRAFT_827869 [Amylocystis lapponica]|nr:hypothetical protein B0H21DRAFT_828200 [Amylocystis lapponica]KAH9917090.1 hypothetical protein B0H21DRAFT_827869 [Amylocystis lapponica]
MFCSLPLSLLLLLSSALAQTSSSRPSPTPSISGSSPSSSASTNSSSASVTGSATSSANYPSLSGYSTCVDQCLDIAVSDTGCESLVDVQCFCTKHVFPHLPPTTRFEGGLSDCMAQNCPASLGTAEGLAQQFCNLASPAVSLSFSLTSLPSSSASSSSSAPSSSSASSTTSPPTAASSSSAPPPSSTSPNAARAMPGAQGGALAVGLGLAGLGVLLGL